MKKASQEGFTYIEVMCAMVVLLVGILAQLSAICFSVLRQNEAEKQNMARQIASSTLESIFAARDLAQPNGISSWNTINNDSVNKNGIFVTGWYPVRRSAGADGIQGTKDDACAADTTCQSGGYTNNSEIIPGYERQIIITDIQETGNAVVKKRQLEIKIRYFVGQAQREQSFTTIISDLPFYK